MTNDAQSMLLAEIEDAVAVLVEHGGGSSIANSAAKNLLVLLEGAPLAVLADESAWIAATLAQLPWAQLAHLPRQAAAESLSEDRKMFWTRAAFEIHQLRLASDLEDAREEDSYVD